ncbi:MAG: protein phosphatase 2C domain-containing protein [Blastocatellia bacterium]|nr:protein phosphatase 2C domain-containing protein [Blastocatellia bacterium]
MSTMAKPFKRGSYGLVSDRGLNPRRPVNEDSYVVLDDVGLFAVADGVGGQNAGEIASRTAMEILRHHFSGKTRGDRMRYLEQVIAYLNGALREMAMSEESLSGMATTLAVLLLEPRHAVICHIGDSRVYRFAAGKLYRETIDHTLVEAEHLGGFSILEYTKKYVLTRALGIGEEVIPDMKKIGLEPNTVFLLCTDGITRHVTDEELQDLLARESDPQRVCDRLKELCYERGARDNFTALVVRVDSVSPRPSRSERGVEWEGRGLLESTAEGRPSLSTASDASEASAGRRVLPSESERSLTMDLRRLGRAYGVVLLVALLSAIVLFIAGMNVERWRAERGGVSLSTTERAHAHLDRAIERFRAGQYAEAERILEEGIRWDSSNGLYHHWLGQTRFALGEYRTAAESFVRAMELGGSEENLLFAAAAWQAAGESERARDFLQRYVQTVVVRRTSEGKP